MQDIPAIFDPGLSRQNVEDITAVTTKLEKLLTDFEHAKKCKNYPLVYKTKREIQREINVLSKNKKFYQDMKSKHSQLMKKLALWIEREYEL